jgi:hypothetical protein
MDSQASCTPCFALKSASFSTGALKKMSAFRPLNRFLWSVSPCGRVRPHARDWQRRSPDDGQAARGQVLADGAVPPFEIDRWRHRSYSHSWALCGTGRASVALGTNAILRRCRYEPHGPRRSHRLRGFGGRSCEPAETCLSFIRRCRGSAMARLSPEMRHLLNSRRAMPREERSCTCIIDCRQIAG